MADRINMLAGDFDTIRTELFAKLQSLPNWKDVQESSVGNTLIRLYAYLGDLLFYKLNTLANENYHETVQIKDNMLKIIKMLNYKMRRAIPSHGTTTFFMNNPHDYNIVIPQNTRLRTGEGTTFYTTKECEIIQGNIFVNCNVVQGLQEELHKSSDATQNQEYYLNIDNKDFYIGGDIWQGTGDAFSGIQVYVDGVLWEEIASLVVSNEDDGVYIIENFNDFGVKIRFGDGTFGRVPPLNADIKFIYNVNIGKWGNVNASDIRLIDSQIVDGALNQVTLLVENEFGYLNGDNPEETESIRANAPKYFKTGDRGITDKDFIAMILSQFPNIIGINVWAEEDKYPPNFKLYNQVNVCLLLEDKDTGEVVDPITHEKDYNEYYFEVDRLIEQKRSLTVWRNYVVPEKVEVSVRVRFKKFQNFTYSDIEPAIETSLSNYFIEKAKLGVDINHSDIIHLIENVAGVDFCFIDLKNNLNDAGYAPKNIVIEENQYAKLVTPIQMIKEA